MSAAGRPRPVQLPANDDRPTLATIPRAEFEAAQAKLLERPASMLRVATWNIWFDRLQMSQRTITLIRLLLHEAPDLIGLQEVTPHVLRALQESAALREVYDVSPVHISQYGCLILARRDLNASFSEITLPTSMGRSLLVAACAGRHRGFTFATVHLESLSNRATRTAQLEVAARMVASRGSAVLCGDFNFDSEQEWGDWRTPRPRRAAADLENTALKTVLPQFSDAWPTLYPNERGLTFDGERNPYVRDSGERMRYDRVMVRGPTPLRAQLLGVMLGDDGVEARTLGASTEGNVVPSDHYGVCVDLQAHGDAMQG